MSPDVIAPAHPVQSASARLHPRSKGMGGASLRAWEVVGIRFVVAGGCSDLMGIPCCRRHVRFWG